MGDYDDDTVIDVRLPRAEYKILKELIHQKEAYNWFYNWIISNWIFIVGSSVLTLILLYEKIQGFIGIK